MNHIDGKPKILLAYPAHRGPDALINPVLNDQNEALSVFARFKQERTFDISSISIHDKDSFSGSLDQIPSKEEIQVLHLEGSLRDHPYVFDPKGFASILASLPNLKIVFLNGCATLPLVEVLLLRDIPIVIGAALHVQRSEVGMIAAEFYKQLAAGKTIRRALEITQTKIRGAMILREAAYDLETDNLNWKGPFRLSAMFSTIFFLEHNSTHLDWQMVKATKKLNEIIFAPSLRERTSRDLPKEVDESQPLAPPEKKELFAPPSRIEHIPNKEEPPQVPKIEEAPPRRQSIPTAKLVLPPSEIPSVPKRDTFPERREIINRRERESQNPSNPPLKPFVPSTPVEKEKPVERPVRYGYPPQPPVHYDPSERDRIPYKKEGEKIISPIKEKDGGNDQPIPPIRQEPIRNIEPPRQKIEPPQKTPADLPEVGEELPVAEPEKKPKPLLEIVGIVCAYLTIAAFMFGTYQYYQGVDHTDPSDYCIFENRAGVFNLLILPVSGQECDTTYQHLTESIHSYLTKHPSPKIDVQVASTPICNFSPETASQIFASCRTHMILNTQIDGAGNMSFQYIAPGAYGEEMMNKKIQMEIPSNADFLPKPLENQLAMLVGGAMVKRAQARTAIAYLEEVPVVEEPGYVSTAFYLAQAHALRKDFGTARHFFDLVLSLDSTNAPAFRGRGTVLANQLDFERALDDYSRAIQYDPNGVETYCNRSVLNLKLGRFDEAVGDIEAAISIDSTYGRSYGILAAIYAEKEEYEPFYESLETALRTGLNIKPFLEYSKVKEFQSEPRFQALVEKYR